MIQKHLFELKYTTENQEGTPKSHRANITAASILEAKQKLIKKRPSAVNMIWLRTSQVIPNFRK